MTKILRSIFGSESSAGVLSFLAAYRLGYASEIARYIGMDLFAVQKQLEKFEADGLLTSRTEGRTRIYSFNTKYPLVAEVKSLVEKAASLQTQEGKVEKVTLLPKNLEPFFWDYPFEKLSWETDRELVIRRLLSDGSWEAVTWLRRQMGDDVLRKWLITHRGRGLSRRQLRFWSLALRIPARQVRSWAVNEAWRR
jgi:predicted transcriptional regulator